MENECFCCVSVCVLWSRQFSQGMNGEKKTWNSFIYFLGRE